MFFFILAVHVSIFGRIEGYGDNLTFICTLDKNLQSPIDNKRWYIDGRLCSINNKTNDPEKLKAQIIPDGVQLTILNFLTQDINKTYSCIIGFYQSEKLILSESDVFRGTNTYACSLSQIYINIIAHIKMQEF